MTGHRWLAAAVGLLLVAGVLSTAVGLWHTVTCVHAATSVSQWVDGVLVAQKTGSTGRIDNREPFILGGKRLCNQRSVGCDYFSGLIDWARITQG